MTAPRLLYALLAVVAAAAAVLSFSALRDLAAVCGFSPRLAWLLPVVIDAGAAAGSLVWLGGQVAEQARRFARGLALVLLGSSVAANALGHGLAAYSARPHWLVVVVVSAIAPAVLGAVVHLAVLVGRGTTAGSHPLPEAAEQLEVAEPDSTSAEPEAGYIDPQLVDDRGLSLRWADVPPAPEPDMEREHELDDEVRRLIADGMGRRALARELGISEHSARQLIDQVRDAVPAGAGERRG